MKSLITIIAALLIGSTVACEVGDGAPLTADLQDPETGEVVGFKDLTTGEYVFDDGSVVPDEEIDRSEDAALATKEGAVMSFKPMAVTKSGSGGGTSATAFAGGGGCWTMKEGGAMCTGCCVPVGDGAFHCWEYCYDVSSSGLAY